jgi:hypothetical protein
MAVKNTHLCLLLVFRLALILELGIMHTAPSMARFHDESLPYPYDAVDGAAWRFVQYSSATLDSILTFLESSSSDEDIFMVD